MTHPLTTEAMQEAAAATVRRQGFPTEDTALLLDALDLSHVPERTVMDDNPRRTRRDDHATSEAGARAVAFRAGTQKAKLLAAYAEVGATGMNAYEACVAVGFDPVTTCYWKRVSELVQTGHLMLLHDDGKPVTRIGAAGVRREVYAITAHGRLALMDHGVAA